MALTERLIDASPATVFGVLADPRSYAYWVIGSLEIREADCDWPQTGTRFHHTVGIGPLRVKDHTCVEDVRPGEFLQLKTRARPLGNARVKLQLEPAGRATRVTMTEDPADKPTALLFTPPTHALVHRRNVRSLGRLAELAEGRRPIPGDEPEADVSTPNGDGSVKNPEARKRRSGWATAGAVSGAAVVLGVIALLLSRHRR